MNLSKLVIADGLFPNTLLRTTLLSYSTAVIFEYVCVGSSILKAYNNLTLVFVVFISH